MTPKQYLRCGWPCTSAPVVTMGSLDSEPEGHRQTPHCAAGTAVLSFSVTRGFSQVPGHIQAGGPPAPGPNPAPTGQNRVRDAVINAASAVTVRVLSHIPDTVKRLLLGGRSVTVDGNTLDTTLQLMLAAQRAAGIDGLVASDDLAVARSQLRALSGMLDPRLPADTTNLVIAGPAGPIPARHYRPLHGEVSPLLVYYHGGGFALGDLDTHDDLCRLICHGAGVHVLSVDYRLAPEHKQPAATDDAYAAYQWALDNAGQLGADPDRVAVGGDSAGGNLAAVVSLRARDAGVRLPALQLLLYPVTDLCGQTRSRTLFAEGYFLTKRDLDWFMDQYLTGAPAEQTDPLLSPLLADDLSGLPPALVLTAGFDPLRDEGNAYAQAMQAAGVTVDWRQYGSLIHAFASFFPLGGASATATMEMISAMQAHLSRA